MISKKSQEQRNSSEPTMMAPATISNKPKKQLCFSEATEEFEHDREDRLLQEEDGMDFKMKQRRRSSVAKTTTDGGVGTGGENSLAAGRRRSSAVSGESGSGYSSSDDEDDVSPILKKQQTPSGFSDFCIRNIEQANRGRNEIKLAEKEMLGIMALRKLYEKEKPLNGSKIICCTHINGQTAVLVETLASLGAKLRWCSCNIYSTQDEIAAAVATNEVSVFAWKGENEEDYWWCIDKCLTDVNWQPNMILDDGGDATDRMQKQYPAAFSRLKGVVEESLIGVHRLYAMLKKGKLTVPAVKINDSIVKSKFDTSYSSKESIIDALKRTSNIIFGGLKVVVCGHGKVGRGCCSSLSALGSRIYVTEIDPICALEACMEGYSVVQLEQVIDRVDCLVTCTGNKNVLQREHMNRMKAGCIVCNMGHPYTEIDVKSIKSIDLTWQRITPQVDHIVWPDGKHIVLISEGRLATLGNSQTPSFMASINASIQVLALVDLFQAGLNSYEKGVYSLPKKIDEQVAMVHLAKFDANLTVLSEEQSHYLGINKAGPFKPKSYRY